MPFSADKELTEEGDDNRVEHMAQRLFEAVNNDPENAFARPATWSDAINRSQDESDDEHGYYIMVLSHMRLMAKKALLAQREFDRDR